MTRVVHFAIPGNIATPTGGYAYARRLIAELPRHGWRVEPVTLPGSFPLADAAALAKAEMLLSALPQGATVLIDGLAFGAMPDIARALSGRLDLVALVHHPLADETGLAPELAAALEDTERAALTQARAVICTSRTTAQRLIDNFGVAPHGIAVAPPGTDIRHRAPCTGEAPLIVSLGALIPRKGHDVLVRALAALQHLPWTARIIGAADRDPDWALTLGALVLDLGLGARVSFVGTVADPDTELARAAIFALATRHEGYGMAFAEALAHGLPVVGCRVGGVCEAVPEQAGLLVPPDDPAAFAAALAPLIADPAFRQKQADAAWAAAQGLPRWRDTAAIVARCLAAGGR